MRNLMMAAVAASLVVPAATVTLPGTAEAQRVYHGRPRHYYCGHSSGRTGLIAGAVGGALLGGAIGGDALGAVVGAGAGGLLGRHLDKRHHYAQCRHYR